MANDPNWAAIAALAVSALAILRTMASDRRQSRNTTIAQTAARFEADFGDPIRDELRAYERALRTLRVFRLASAKDVTDRVLELDDLRPEWEQASSSLEALLREADVSERVDATYWADTFQSCVEDGDRVLDSIVGAHDPPPDAEFRRLVNEALGHYDSAIGQTRSALDAERRRFAQIEAHTLWSWMRETFLWWRP
ncbi:MAG: hypothetical protein QOG72_48 [Sphingomonadales bacterium]|jgi:hypothetical protein|nr:hypothetical protein [Sphingomonadales bacterium]